MDEAKLKQIEQSIINDIDSTVKLERDLHEMGKEAAHDIIKIKKAKVEVQDSVYEMVANINGNRIFLVASDVEKLKILQGRYIPYTITIDIENKLSIEANLAAAIEAWMRHKYDLTNVQELDD